VTVAIAIVGAAAISRHGAGWRGLGEALAAGAALPGVPALAPLGQPKVQKMMSRGAYLAASCLGALVREARIASPSSCGYFLGVGASGGSLDDVIALLAESIAGGGFSLARFGDRGLGACNPLLAFQLMNNFTLCHGAILEGLGGPNAALFSRGAGTTAALIEAVHAIADQDCAHAIAGGADSALHPVTLAELARERERRPALAPSRAAQARDASSPRTALGVVEGHASASGDAGGSAGPGRDQSGRLAFTPTEDTAPGAIGVAPTNAAPSGVVEESELVPSEGAALLALQALEESPNTDVLGVVEGSAIASGLGRPLVEAVEEAVTRAVLTGADLVVIAPWCRAVAAELRGWAHDNVPDALVVDTSALGEALAASPALAWVAALDLLVAGRARRALVLGAGTDGDIGAVVLAREPA